MPGRPRAPRLIAAADAALYEAKRAGKNRVAGARAESRGRAQSAQGRTARGRRDEPARSERRSARRRPRRNACSAARFGALRRSDPRERWESSTKRFASTSTSSAARALPSPSSSSLEDEAFGPAEPARRPGFPRAGRGPEQGTAEAEQRVEEAEAPSRRRRRAAGRRGRAFASEAPDRRGLGRARTPEAPSESAARPDESAAPSFDDAERRGGRGRACDLDLELDDRPGDRGRRRPRGRRGAAERRGRAADRSSRSTRSSITSRTRSTSAERQSRTPRSS